MCISGRGRLKHDRQTADRYQVPNHRGVLTDPVRDSMKTQTAPRREARGCGLLVPTYVQAKHAEHDREIL